MLSVQGILALHPPPPPAAEDVNGVDYTKVAGQKLTADGVMPRPGIVALVNLNDDCLHRG
jgi:hypothetical protein